MDGRRPIAGGLYFVSANADANGDVSGDRDAGSLRDAQHHPVGHTVAAHGHRDLDAFSEPDTHRHGHPVLYTYAGTDANFDAPSGRSMDRRR
jgi:hypothetical protein